MSRGPAQRCRRCAAVLDRAPAPHPTHGFQAFVCPSCGAAEPVHLYPRPSGATERWAVLGAAGWLLAWIGFVGGALFVCTAVTVALTVEAVDRSEWMVRDAYKAWYRVEHPDFAGSIPWWEPWEFRRWWEAQGPEAVAAIKAGGGVMEWVEMLPLLIVFASAFAAAALLAVAMPHRRPWAMTLAALPVIALLLAGAGIAWAVVRMIPVSSADVVMSRFWLMPLLMVSLALLGASMIAGLWIGRSCARGVVSAFLPPRRRAPLAWLWTADGRAAPRSVEIEP